MPHSSFISLLGHSDVSKTDDLIAPRSPWLTSYLHKSRSFSELSCSCFTNCKIYWDNNYLLNNFNCIDFNFFIKKSISLNNTKIIIYFPSYYQKLLFDYGINYWLFSRKCYYILKSYTVYYDTEIQYRHNFIKSGLKKKKKKHEARRYNKSKHRIPVFQQRTLSKCSHLEMHIHLTYLQIMTFSPLRIIWSVEMLS